MKLLNSSIRLTNCLCWLVFVFIFYFQLNWNFETRLMYRKNSLQENNIFGYITHMDQSSNSGILSTYHPSLSVIHPPYTFHISIFLSQSTGPDRTILLFWWSSIFNVIFVGHCTWQLEAIMLPYWTNSQKPQWHIIWWKCYIAEIFSCRVWYKVVFFLNCWSEIQDGHHLWTRFNYKTIYHEMYNIINIEKENSLMNATLFIFRWCSDEIKAGQDQWWTKKAITFRIRCQIIGQ